MTTRREFLRNTALAGAAVSLQPSARAAESTPRGKAEHCVLIWLGGGACQIDTWDPKRLGDPQQRKAGSAYHAIETAIAGTQVCEHLSRCARILDRFNIVRTCHHSGFPDHAAATHFVHTGRPTSGSRVTHCRGPVNDRVPSYVLMGYPNVSRGPGFLGARAGYVYLTDTHTGPQSFTREPSLDSARVARREKLLAGLRAEYVGRHRGYGNVEDYDRAIEEALRLSGPEFRRVFALSDEPESLRNAYGSEFGQRCLLARRLVQSGVRFVEVSHNMNFVNGSGWDTHRQGQLKQHLLIQDLDRGLATLVEDLEKSRLLDSTLVVVATEFGRPASWDGGGGRGHHDRSFSMVLAGGGLRNGVTIGETDELGMKTLSQPVSVPDFHATIACALGIDPAETLYDGDRPVPLTDHGQPIRELFG